ncbi:MAG: acyltransferase, partial [Frateuria sp.]|nr:acyltransferase [Frateuria sp.]
MRMKGATALPAAAPADPTARGHATAGHGSPFSGSNGAKAASSTGTRMPSLDGLRAVSILMVCYGHLCGTRRFPVSIAQYGRWCGDVAHLGVLVFFVISGFLITLLLMGERETTGGISLKRFYLRRMVRIFPAFYAFILVMAVATASGAVQLTGRD